MLSFENSAVNEYGPQHSTPVKGQEAFLSKTQRGENNVHPSKTGRVAPSDINVNKSDDCNLIQHVDHANTDISNTTANSIVDISNISMIKCISDIQPVHNSCMYMQDNNITLIPGNQNCEHSKTYSNICTKHPIQHQVKHPFSHKLSQTPGILEQEQTFNRHDFGTSFHTGFRCSRAMPSDSVSDSDLFKQSLSPMANYRHDTASEMSYSKVTISSGNERPEKAYCVVRSNSAPRYLSDEVNILNRGDYNLPTYSVSDFRRAPAVYIEQDIINKQRQEIQLLMEELGNRDQELNDLVVSHQKQVKAWESDNERFIVLQDRLGQYEDELKSRENQLKETLSEMSQVNEQREVDALELKQTQNEMMKLAERIMENSVYIKEMESQNQKLSYSLKELVNARKSFSVREQDLLSVIEDKNSALSSNQKKIAEMDDHLKYLECRCEELGERNNNTAVESINWKKKYFQVKEEAEKLNVECKIKEDNAQKMTQQLHESLQQAIALQKALFTSCEREKCKEEVMYSLRKQHKRTMQELQNIRELYDRLSRDNTLYHLSVKDKEVMKDGKRKEEDVGEGKARKGKNEGNVKPEEEADKRRQESRRKHESNMSSQKSKHLEINEQSFLVKETKERKIIKDDKSGDINAGKASEKIINKFFDKNVGISNPKNKICKEKMDRGNVHASDFESAYRVMCQKLEPKIPPKILKADRPSSPFTKSGHHTTMYRNIATITSSTTLFSDQAHMQRAHNSRFGSLKKKTCPGSSFNEMHSSGFENTSRNADFHGSRSNSRDSTIKSVSCKARSPFTAAEDMSVIEIDKDKDAACESSSDVSHIASPSQFDDELTPADSDGMCHELKRNISRIDSQHLDRMSPMRETSCLESKRSRTPSNSFSLPPKGSFLRKDTAEKKTQYMPDDLSKSTVKQNLGMKMVEFDASEELTKSASMETQSQFIAPDPDSECSSSLTERRHISPAGANNYSYTKTCLNFSDKKKQSSPGRKHMKTFLNEAKPSGIQNSHSGRAVESSSNNNPHSGRAVESLSNDNPNSGRAVESLSINNPNSGRMHLQKIGQYLCLQSGSEQEQENPGEDCHKSSFEGNLSQLRCQNLENGTTQKNIKSCSQCRSQGKTCCTCSVAPQAYTTSANKTSNFESNLPQSKVRYSLHSGLISASSKLSFNEIDSLVEYNSAFNKSQRRPLKSVERCRFKMCVTSDETNGSSFHCSDQKTSFTSPENKPGHYSSTKFTKSPIFLCSDLPERVSTYLAKHLSVKRELYNSNNSRSVDHLNFDMSSRSEIPEKGNETLLYDQNKLIQHNHEENNFEKGFVDKRESPQDKRESPQDKRESPQDKRESPQDKRESPQDKRESPQDKRESPQDKRESPQDSPLLCTHTADAQDSVVKESEEQTWIRYENGKWRNKDAAEKDMSEGHKDLCHTSQTNMEDKANVRVEGHRFHKSKVVASSDLDDVVCTTKDRLETAQQPDQDKYISAKSCAGKIKFTEMSCICPKEPHSQRKFENNCELKLFNVKGKEEAGLCQVTSGSTSSSQTSLTNKEQSLYKHLSQIHFSEKTRRYEWTTQPVVTSQNIASINLLHSDHSTNQETANFEQINLAAKDGVQDKATPDVTESRLRMQLSDSGHFSINGVSSGPVNHKEKQNSHRNQRSENDASHWKCNQSGNTSQLPSSELVQDPISDTPSRGLEQYLNNKNSNNNYCSLSLHKNYCSLPEMRRSSAISHLPSYNLDPLVKRLDFNDTALQENESQSSGFEICGCIQCCLPTLNRFGRSHTEMNEFSDTSNFPSNNWDPVVKRLNFNDTTIQESQLEAVGSEICGLSQCCLPTSSNSDESISGCSNSRTSPRYAQTMTSKASLGNNVTQVQAGSKCGSNIRCHNEQSSLVKERCINPECTIIIKSPQCFIPVLSATNDSPQCIKPVLSTTSDSPQCNNSVHSVTSHSPQCNNPVHSVTSDSPQYIKLVLSTTSHSPQCISPVFSVTSDSPQCISPVFSVTSDSPQCISPVLSTTSDSPQCISPVLSAANDNSQIVSAKTTPAILSNRLLTDSEDHSNMSYLTKHPQDISTFPSHFSFEEEIDNVFSKSNKGNIYKMQGNHLEKMGENTNSDIECKLLNINMGDKGISGSVDIEDAFTKIDCIDDVITEIDHIEDAIMEIDHIDDAFTKIGQEVMDDAMICKMHRNDNDGNFTKLHQKDIDDTFIKMPDQDNGDVFNKIHQDIDEAVVSHKIPFYSKEIEILRRESDNIQVIKTFDPGTSFRSTNNPQEPLGCDLACFDDLHCDTAVQKQLGTFLEDTRDSNTSISYCPKDAQAIPAWLYEDSVEEVSDNFDDTLSTFLDDSRRDNESFMGTPLSPVTKLFKLLVESQEMIKSLEKSSGMSNVAGFH